MTKLIATSIMALAGGVALAQQIPLTLEQAVQQASDRYPAVKSSLEQVLAAEAQIRLVRTSYLPRADFIGQVNRASHNNEFGMLLTQPVISPISGPVQGTNSLGSVWGSAVGVQVAWEPFDFGLRRALLAEAQIALGRAGTEVAVTRLQVEAAAADAFLTILAADESAVAARAAVERARVLGGIVDALVKNELKPGADASRAHVEIALAENQLIEAEQAAEVARAGLAQLLGVDPHDLSVQPGPLLQLPPEQPPTAFAPANHPLALAQAAAIAEVKSKEKALDRSYFPRFDLQGTSYARGTGISPDGTTGGAASGLGPNIQNWGLGITVTFSAFDFSSLKARKEIELHNELREADKYDQFIQDLNGQMGKARATLAGAQRVARNTPTEVEAARAGAQQADARYRSGLGNIVEVAEADRILAQAEVDDALARLGVWRALLAVAAASGDLQQFLEQSRK